MEHLTEGWFATIKVHVIKLSQNARDRSEFLVQFRQFCCRVTRSVVRQQDAYDLACGGKAGNDSQTIFGCLRKKAPNEVGKLCAGYTRRKCKGIVTGKDIGQHLCDLLSIGGAIDPVFQRNVCRGRHASSERILMATAGTCHLLHSIEDLTCFSLSQAC
jgi:hypothetical protein